jgi:hypothetical protein
VIDARPLRLICRLPIRRGRDYPHSIAWHRIDSQPCQCHSLHGHCFAVVCPCPRHEGEIN